MSNSKSDAVSKSTDFNTLPCHSDIDKINSLLKDFQSKYPYIEQLFLVRNQETDNVYVLGSCVNLDLIDS